MLVLSRGKGEQVAIADKSGRVIAVVTLTNTERGKARIGFDAGDEIVIHREEVYTRIYGKAPVAGE